MFGCLMSRRGHAVEFETHLKFIEILRDDVTYIVIDLLSAPV